MIALMPRIAALSILLLVGMAAFPGPFQSVRAAEHDRTTTDANLLTALDVSGSVFRHHEWLQYVGLANAVRDPDFVAAATAGPRGRIGFAVYTWSSGGVFTTIVPWTQIGSQADAETVSQIIENSPRYWSNASDSRTAQAYDRFEHRSQESETDLSSAMDFGRAVLVRSPYWSNRNIFNVVGNGPDNIGQGPGPIRDLLSASGVTTNALVLGGNSALTEYYRTNVAGGSGSFVLEVGDPADFRESMVLKFLLDMAALDNHSGTDPVEFAPRATSKTAPPIARNIQHPGESPNRLARSRQPQ